MKKIKYLLVCFVFFCFTVTRAQNRQPNIILIVSDDQGYHDLGCMGNSGIKTPHIDQLAEEGVRFTNFYAACSVCTPSRSSLLTGRYPQRNGTYELFRNDRVNDGYQYNEQEYDTSPERILGTDLREVFISEILEEAGYTNGIFGKWDLGQLRRYLPLQQGFDRFYGFVNTGIDYFTHERYGIPSMYSGNELTTEDKGTYTTYLFKREAIEFVKDNKDKPFFLYLPFNAPHSASNLDPDIRSSVQAPEEFLKMYPEGTTKKERRMQGYRAAVTCMDESIGEILDLVKSYNLEKNTLVIFLSDNGGGIGSDNSPLRGGKGRFFEGGVRVPCIMKWPAKIKAGKVSHSMLSTLEIFPTILAVAGIKPPDSIRLDGFDMDLTGGKGNFDNVRNEMFWELRGDYAARVGKWKWVSSSRDSGLFDLEKDIVEQNDLTEEKPEIVRMIQQKFEGWQTTMKNAPPRGPFRDF